MRLNLKRLIPWCLALIFSGLLVALRPNSSLWVVVILASLTVIAWLVLLADVLLDHWMKRHVGEGASFGSFLREEISSLLAAGGLLAAFMMAVLTIRVMLPDGVDTALLIASGISASIGLLGLLMKLVPAIRRTSPLHRILERVSPPSLKSDLREAIEFQKICAGRLLWPLSALWGLAFLAYGLIALIGYGLGELLLPRWDALLDIDRAPPLAKVIILLLIGVTTFSIVVPILTTFRIVWRMKVRGRLRKNEATKEFGMAVEKSGFVGVFGFGVSWFVFLCLCFLAWQELAFRLNESYQFSPLGAHLIGLTPILICVWVLMIWPQTYLFSIMSHRDCGWMNGFKASLELVMLERRDSLVRAGIATLFFASIIFIPAAIFLLHTALENRRLLLAAILNEKTTQQLEQELSNEESDRPATLKKFYDLLEKGRYLDALNGFQMQLMRDPENVHALEGQSLAYLRMGNPQARESVERWFRLDPDNSDVGELLEQMAEGRWSEQGDLFQEAQRKCTQIIGRGV